MFKLFRNSRDFNEFQLMDWMCKHNPDVIIKDYNYDYKPVHLISKVPIAKLKLPNGWYYNEKNGLTNKHNSTTGLYSCVKIIFQ